MTPAEIPHLLVHASTEFILPRFRRLAAQDIAEKSPGELVTAVDRDVEAFLAPALRALVPGSLVIGEEDCSANPSLLERVGEDDVWLVDPLDGTGNFIAGSGDFGILVARLRNGRCVASWMYRPVGAVMDVAELGGGAWSNDVRLRIRGGEAPSLRGVVKTRFLPAGVKERVLEGASRMEASSGSNCTAVDYPQVCSGAHDFALYWRTLPWDHAAPALLLEEAGGTARRLDGTAYRPADRRDGLLVARSEEAWQRARHLLLD